MAAAKTIFVTQVQKKPRFYLQNILDNLRKNLDENAYQDGVDQHQAAGNEEPASPDHENNQNARQVRDKMMKSKFNSRKRTIVGKTVDQSETGYYD